jgi:hypothetical protein
MNPILVHPFGAPIGWTDYPSECLEYFVWMGISHIIIFIIGSILLLFCSLKNLKALPRRLFKFGMFLGIFLVVGSLVNGVWGCSTFNRLYHSYDYFFDFIPFWPVGSFAEHPQVEAYGTTLTELNLLWFIFAAFTWGSTIAIYRFTRRKLAQRTSRRARNPRDSKGIMRLLFGLRRDRCAVAHASNGLRAIPPLP